MPRQMNNYKKVELSYLIPNEYKNKYYLMKYYESIEDIVVFENKAIRNTIKNLTIKKLDLTGFNYL